MPLCIVMEQVNSQMIRVQKACKLGPIAYLEVVRNVHIKCVEYCINHRHHSLSDTLSDLGIHQRLMPVSD